MVEAAAVALEGDDAAGQQLPRALLQLLLDQGVISRGDVRAEMEAMDERGRRCDGARLVARAWTDPAFKVIGWPWITPYIPSHYFEHVIVI